MSNITFKTVLISGATGELGKPIVDAFLDDGTFKIRVLTREASADVTSYLYPEMSLYISYTEPNLINYIV